MGVDSTPNPSGANSVPVADAVETALADAILKAAGAERFDVVAALVKELEARRVARAASNVVAIGKAKAGR